MNYARIDIDEEVAFVNYRSRGGPYPMFARKGLVIDKKKIKKWHNKSMTGQLLVQVPTVEADRHNPNPDFDDSPTTEFWIDAYNVIDFWDRFIQERDHLYAEQIERLEQAQIERMDREAALEEDRKVRLERKLGLQKKTEVALSLPQGSVEVTDTYVMIRREVLESRFLEKVVNG